MELRRYQNGDCAIIRGWIKDEKSLYQWSAHTIGKFPFTDSDMEEFFSRVINDDRVILLSAVDDNGSLIGHLRIRYPDEADQHTVRFGFVIIDPALRGQGIGRKMLELAIDYAKDSLCATRITLGVFANNSRARSCYESVGFRATGETEIYAMPIGEWECTEMELILS